MKTKLLWLVGLISSSLFICVALGSVIYAAAPANCNTNASGAYGRGWQCSYFSNIPVSASSSNGYSLSWVLVPTGQTNYSGITPNWQTTPITLNSFIAGIQARLFDTTSNVNEARAAAIVDVMLGEKGPAFGGSVANGISYAQSNWNTWVSRVSEYASGQYSGYSVNFNDFVNFGNVTQTDGMGVVENDPSGATDCNSPVQCIPDVAFQDVGDDPTPDFAVVFNYPGGEFIIKDKCGNLTGDTAPLPSPVPPATVACAGLTTSVATPDPSQPFTLETAVRYSPGNAASSAFGPDKVAVQVIGPSPYHGYSQTISNPSISNGVATASLTVPATNVSGTFTVNWQVTGAQAPTVSCSEPISVAYEPYFDVLGGDVSAGQGFGAGCTDDPSADITGYNLDTAASSGNYFGAGTRQAALATGTISNFATDITNNIPSNLGGSSDGIPGHPPSVLAGSNVGVSPPVYGKDYLGSYTGTWCVPDYIANVTGTSGTALPNFSTLAPSSTTYVYRVPNGATLGNFQVPAGVHVTVIVSGNVYVNGNITYAPYTTTADVPSFTLMTSGGSIYVSPSVTELHGFYDAQPDSSGNGGVIYSCASGIGVPLKSYAGCDNPLTIYGAVSAKQIILGRTAGNLTTSGSVSDTPAEQIVYTPELWLGSLSSPTSSCVQDPSQSKCLYQSYTALPPVL